MSLGRNRQNSQRDSAWIAEPARSVTTNRVREIDRETERDGKRWTDRLFEAGSTCPGAAFQRDILVEIGHRGCFARSLEWNTSVIAYRCRGRSGISGMTLEVVHRHEKLAPESDVEFMAPISGAGFRSVCKGPKTSTRGV